MQDCEGHFAARWFSRLPSDVLSSGPDPRTSDPPAGSCLLASDPGRGPGEGGTGQRGWAGTRRAGRPRAGILGRVSALSGSPGNYLASGRSALPPVQAGPPRCVIPAACCFGGSRGPLETYRPYAAPNVPGASPRGSRGILARAGPPGTKGPPSRELPGNPSHSVAWLGRTSSAESRRGIRRLGHSLRDEGGHPIPVSRAGVGGRRRGSGR